MVGEKDVASAGGGVPVGNAPQDHGALLSLGVCEADGLVGDHPLGFVDFPALQHLKAGVALQPGDEEDFLGGQLSIPGIVGIAQVRHDNGAFGQAKAAGLPDLVLPGRGEGHKGWQIAVMVQQGLELDTALAAAAGSPGKQRQAEAHHRGVQAEELVFELEFVLRGQRLAAPIHQGKQRLKEGSGAVAIGAAPA